MAEREDFWARVAMVYDNGVDYVLGSDLRPMVLDRLGTGHDLGRTVEFGCGTGYFTPLLAQLSETVVATDIAEPMLERTRDRVAGLSNVTVQAANCEATTFSPASFDTAFLGLIFQLVNGPGTIAEMHRILKPGGSLIIAVPTMEGLRFPDKARGIIRNYRAYGTLRPPGTKLYTRRSLPPILARGGFALLETEHLNDRLHPGGFTGLWVKAEKEPDQSG